MSFASGGGTRFGASGVATGGGRCGVSGVATGDGGCDISRGDRLSGVVDQSMVVANAGSWSGVEVANGGSWCGDSGVVGGSTCGPCNRCSVSRVVDRRGVSGVVDRPDASGVVDRRGASGVVTSLMVTTPMVKLKFSIITSCNKMYVRKSW